MIINDKIMKITQMLSLNSRDHDGIHISLGLSDVTLAKKVEEKKCFQATEIMSFLSMPF